MNFQRTRVHRPDGRYLLYYSFDRPPPELLLGPGLVRPDGLLELRRNQLLDEWVIIATERQDRTFLPPAEYCPLCPTSGDFVTEVPSADYEIVVFENRFPSLRPDAPVPRSGLSQGQRAAAEGAAEVVLYTPVHDATLAEQPVQQIERLIDVWADRYEELGRRAAVEYVFIFENRGPEIGVTLTHPHGQIYAYPFVPPHVGRELAAAAAHERRHGTCLLCDIVAAEEQEGSRIVAANEQFVAYVPFAARLPYEVHIASRLHRETLSELDGGERERLASLLKTVLQKYDNLWSRPMPFVMSVHQRPTDGIQRPGVHLHFEFTPPYRRFDRLKYLAGSETGAGVFINDTLPEERAEELRRAEPRT